MSEWRKKRYYRPRVLLETAHVLSPLFGDCVVCLSGSQLYMLRNLTQYLHRRSTYVSTYGDGYYLAPDNDEWDDIAGIVADLEGKLMDCESFSNDLAEVLARLRSQGAVPSGYMDEDTRTVFPYNDTVYGTNDDGYNDDACAISQLWYQFGFESITEHVLPATRWGFDQLLPAVTALVVFAVGGPVAAVGWYLVAELASSLVELAYNGAESNLENWLLSVKEDIVCSLYLELAAGSTLGEAWEECYGAVVSPSTSISPGDKAIVDLFMGPPAGKVAAAAFAADTTWAQENVTPGYCTQCLPFTGYYDQTFPPCPGTGYLLGGANCDASSNVQLDADGESVYTEGKLGISGTYTLRVDVDMKSSGPNNGAGIYFRVQQSSDGVNWSPVDSESGSSYTGSNDWQKVSRTFTPDIAFTSDKYYRFGCMHGSHSYDIRVREIEVYLT